MPQQPVASTQNKFIKGLVTEFTGLNFPEDAATDCDNVTFSIVGDVHRRLGIDFETNCAISNVGRTNAAMNTYKWNNAGGDGSTQIICAEISGFILFWKSSAATGTLPLSTKLLSSQIDLSAFKAAGSTFDVTKEATFTSGNGYLFIFHPSCDPIYCTYVADVVVGNRINVQVRDFTGVVDGLNVTARPSTLSDAHLYNLSNQGWTSGSPWSATPSGTWVVAAGSQAFTVAAGITGVTIGDAVTLYGYVTTGLGHPYAYLAAGNVTAYVGTTMTVNVVSVNSTYAGLTADTISIYPVNHGYITTWNTQVGGYPSNADVWWNFKNSSNVFNPGATLNNTSLNSGNAKRGHYIIDVFNQQRDTISSIATITDVVTTVRPRIGTWFQGRVWYTGCDASQAASGTANAYSWSEDIYFSQIIEDVSQFGNCYQTNDPTSETLFDLLPTDGGVVRVQGLGAIYYLFPIQNGLFVFGANGIRFITGSQGVGFSANDYTILDVSSVRCSSSTSFVNVHGLPYFWNEEGIYAVTVKQGGGFDVQSITYNTIDTFYANIPLSSKKFARGAYDPINYTIQWIYRSTEAGSDVTKRYTFDKILNHNTLNKSFFPFTIPSSDVSINGINYVSYPGGTDTPQPSFKYLTSKISTGKITFADEHNENYVDWASDSGLNYISYLVTGYQIRGQAQKTFFPGYLYVFSQTNGVDSTYKIQSIWDYAGNRSSGRWSSIQRIAIPATNYDVVYKRHKLRGHGLALQFKITSVDGQPFDIIGWSSNDNVNTGI